MKYVLSIIVLLCAASLIYSGVVAKTFMSLSGVGAVICGIILLFAAVKLYKQDI